MVTRADISLDRLLSELEVDRRVAPASGEAVGGELLLAHDRTQSSADPLINKRFWGVIILSVFLLGALGSVRLTLEQQPARLDIIRRGPSICACIDAAFVRLAQMRTDALFVATDTSHDAAGHLASDLSAPALH